MPNTGRQEIIADLLAKRSDLRNGLEALASEARGANRDFTDDERSRFDADEQTIRDLDARVKELDEQIRADAAASEVAKRYAPSVKVTSEPEVYRQGAAGSSYFRDLHLARNKGDRDAFERLTRNDRMRADVAQRSGTPLNTGNGTGGEFVPPLWLENEFIRFVRPGRITANLVPTMGLPPGTDSINIPKVLTGTAVAPQTTQNSGINETDLTTTSVNSPVVTIAGGQTVSLQLLEQSPLNIDQVVLADLAADYAQKLNTQVLSGTGTSGQVTGIFTQTGTNQITYTSASPSLGTLYSKIANAVQSIHTQRFLPPDAIVMHPRRWAWALAQLDGQGRPLVVPRAGGPFNVIGNADDVASQGLVGDMMGLPVFVDATIPTNLGTGSNQDEILVARMADLMLWESNVRAEAFQQTYANNMSVFIRLYNYFSFQPARYPQSISVINGTGLTAPTFP